jgi:PAS domain S-box-containing protein
MVAVITAERDRYRQLFQTIKQGYCYFELVRDRAGQAVDQRYLEFNLAFERIFGITVDQATGRLASEIFPELDPAWTQAFDRIAQRGTPERIEQRFSALDRSFEVFVYPDGRDRLSVTFEDVTLSRAADEALRAREERQAFLLKLSDALRAEPDADAVANRAITLVLNQLRLDRCYITYYRPAEDAADFPYQIGNDTVPPLPATVRLSDFPDAYQQVLERTFVIEDDLERPGLSPAERANSQALGMRAMLASTIRRGEKRPLSSMMAVSSTPRRWTPDEIALIEEAAERTWAAIERARADAALRDSEARFRQFADASSDVIWIVDAATGKLEFLSPSFDRIWGVPRQEVLDQPARWTGMLHPDDRDRAARAMPRALAGNQVTERYRIIRGDGETRHIVDVGFPIFGHDGQVIRVGGIAQDVTERRAAEQALQSNERWQRALIEGIPQLVWRAVDGGHWTWASPQWSSFTGQAERDSHDLGWLDPVHPDDRAGVMHIWAGATARGEFHADYRLWHAEAQRFRWFQTRASPVRNEASEVVEWLGTSTDVDDLRELQARQATLLAELQHRVRNILAVTRSIISRSDDGERSLEEYVQHLQGRIGALARTQVLLTRAAGQAVDLETIIVDELQSQAALPEQFAVAGPEVRLSPKTAEVVTLAIHELATNATKYGAFARTNARLDVNWRLDRRGEQQWLVLLWKERGVPVIDAAPRHRGFGAELVTRRIPYELKGHGMFELRAGGAESCIEFPLIDAESILQTDSGGR